MLINLLNILPKEHLDGHMRRSLTTSCEFNFVWQILLPLNLTASYETDILINSLIEILRTSRRDKPIISTT